MTWPPEDVERHDLGHGVSWTKTVDHDDNWVGILEWHPCTGGDVHAGGVYFQNAPESWKGARWTLEKEDPLTISPSVLCKSCGLHGFIREGRWVPV